MDEALYGPDGYYATGRGRSGREGDYITASDTGKAFGALLAELFMQWRALVTPPFQVVEVGAGVGALAEAVRAGLPREISYTAVERSPARREQLRLLAGVQVLEQLDALRAHPIHGCLFANELIDALPVHRVRFVSGRWQEAFVDGPRWEWDTCSTPRLMQYIERLHLKVPEGYETEINLAMADWIRGAAEALASGWVVLIDYGRPARELYDEQRSAGTLRAFRRQRVDAQVLMKKGRLDLTADVDFTSLALDGKEAGLTPVAFMDLSSFLLPAAAAHSRWTEEEQRQIRFLCHPESFGGLFHVLVFEKEVRPHEPLFPHSRLSRLGIL